jgi:hypothetical protein
MNDDENKLSILTPPKIPDFLHEEPRPFERAPTKGVGRSEQISKKFPFSGLKISTMVLLGVLLISIALFLIGSDKILFFLDSFNRAEREAQAEAQAKIESLKLQQKRNEAQAERDHIKAEQQQRMIMEEKRQQQLKLFEKLKQDNVQNQEKQAKWQLYYQISKDCIKPKEWKQEVECADERLKALLRFEELYKAGKI